jgi:hypothetical protein
VQAQLSWATIHDESRYRSASGVHVPAVAFLRGAGRRRPAAAGLVLSVASRHRQRPSGVPAAPGMPGRPDGRR